MSYSLAQKIKEIRLQTGMTGEQFGNKFNPIATKSSVSKWEQGLNRPNSKRLKRIAELGNTTVDELLKSEYRICPNCKYDVIKKEFNYCPICSKKIIKENSGGNKND